MRRWLMKSEPDEFSFADLCAVGLELWTGVRNYQARNYLRIQQPGDLVYFYHSSCAEPGIAGLAEIGAAAIVDPTQFDPASAYFDPKATPAAPRWYASSIRPLRRVVPTLRLTELRAQPALAGFALLSRGTRLSVIEVNDLYAQALDQLLEGRLL